jgi:hypothetical protein
MKLQTELVPNQAKKKNSKKKQRFDLHMRIEPGLQRRNATLNCPGHVVALMNLKCSFHDDLLTFIILLLSYQRTPPPKRTK